jgi:hypothetical protein
MTRRRLAAVAARAAAAALAAWSTLAACGGAAQLPSPVPVAVAAPAPVAPTSSSSTAAAPSEPVVPSVSAAPGPRPTPLPDARETKLVARMLKRVERARHLSAKKPVPGVLLDRTALIARVKDHVARELPPQAIHNEGLALQLFGFVPTEFDYEAAEYQLLQDQLAGYYEPADGTMYMASDLADEEAEATLAHELVHALQDQRWDLQSRSRYRPGDGDESEAVSALAEGDATSAMFDVMLERAAPGSGKTAVDLPDEVFAQQIREGMNQGPGATAPHVMRASLAAPYIYGTLFVHALRRRGGWPAVDRAWDAAPVTSEQVMHPEKWLAHEAAINVRAPTFAALGEGWQVADEDTEGEMGTRIAFEEWMDAKTAAGCSAGWGGDRGVLVENGDRAAFAWRLRYDPGKARDDLSKHAWALMTRAFDGALGAAQTKDADFACRERADRGPLAVARQGADVVFVMGPAHVATGSWTSAGDCALARKWIREIANTP